MVEEKYFVLSRCEDEVMVNQFNRSELLEWLNEDNNTKFLNCIPGDLSYFPSMGAVVIKGNIITPKPINKITEYTVE